MRKVLCSIFSIAMILSIPSAVLALDFVDSSIPNTMVSSYEKEILKYQKNWKTSEI